MPEVPPHQPHGVPAPRGADVEALPAYFVNSETVPNPLIVQDEAERAAAQAVIDATPQEVKDF